MSDFTAKPWSTAPSELWLVGWPNGRIEDANAYFATEKAALDFAKINAQKNDGYFKVYKLTLFATAIPQESQVLLERTPKDPV